MGNRHARSVYPSEWATFGNTFVQGNYHKITIKRCKRDVSAAASCSTSAVVLMTTLSDCHKKWCWTGWHKSMFLADRLTYSMLDARWSIDRWLERSECTINYGIFDSSDRVMRDHQLLN